MVRARRHVLIAVLAAALLPLGASAAADKMLTNVKGGVSFEHDGSAHTIVPKASQLLVDADIAATADGSQGIVTLPDSSKVTLGAQTRVQLAFFNQADIATAKFVVYQGKTRFTVEHPQGAKANYTFVTPTTQIAVRGTEGDIGVDGDAITVNVYTTSDPNLPVEVTFTKGDKAGTTLKVLAGQSLVARLVNGIIQSQVDKITQAALDAFGELGVPTTVEGFKSQAVERAKSALPAVPRPRLPF